MASASLMRNFGDADINASQKRKLRKPIMEKIRRDRINTSIDTLKILLQRHLKDQKANVKLEKADILEMTVNFLKEKGTRCAKPGYKEGCSQCLQETLAYQPAPVSQTVHDPEAIGRFRMDQRSVLEKTTSSKSTLKSNEVPTNSTEQSKGTLWRPW